ncbi:MAG TPA: DUF4197 domain-containing protein [Cytophagaceae bacterium]|nr:DUF4197 domain-containing protein [Cytophagaceae bacterium]
MKKYLSLCLVMASISSYAQLNLDKLKGDIEKVEKATNTTLPTSTTPSNSSSSSNKTLNLSEGEMVQGLKEALTKGASTASQSLNKMDGYYKNPKVKIPVPPEAQHVANTLREYGYGKKVDDFELTLNRAAEQAAKEAAPIFSKAITSMSITDAKGILTGPDTAATGYLRKTTYSSLFTAFKPHIQQAIGDNKVASKWAEITKLYNKIPVIKKPVNTDLVSYTTGRSLQGLFSLVADQEMQIRKDPVARTSDILKKVFGSL